MQPREQEPSRPSTRRQVRSAAGALASAGSCTRGRASPNGTRSSLTGLRQSRAADSRSAGLEDEREEPPARPGLVGAVALVRREEPLLVEDACHLEGKAGGEH